MTWNTCPICHTLVDIPDEAHDGTEIRCRCKAVIVIVEFDGPTFELDVQDEDDCEVCVGEEGQEA